MGYPHHHVQTHPMGSSLDPKFPPSEDYSSNYTNISLSHSNMDYMHHQSNGFNHHQNTNNYGYSQGISPHFYHPHNYGSPQIPHHPTAASAQNNSYNSNNYYSNYYSTNSHNAPIMDLPIQCPTNTEPQNTALGLQELGNVIIENMIKIYKYSDGFEHFPRMLFFYYYIKQKPKWRH